MAKIINLNELIGEDIIIRYGTPVTDYKLPGDIDVETVFELFNMYVNIGVIDAETPEDIFVEVQQKFVDIQARLLELFQERDPKLKKLPFGIKGTGIVLRAALSELGIKIGEPENPTPPNRQVRRAARKTSPRSASKKRSTTRRKK